MRKVYGHVEVSSTLAFARFVYLDNYMTTYGCRSSTDASKLHRFSTNVQNCKSSCRSFFLNHVFVAYTVQYSRSRKNCEFREFINYFLDRARYSSFQKRFYTSGFLSHVRFLRSVIAYVTYFYFYRFTITSSEIQQRSTDPSV